MKKKNTILTVCLIAIFLFVFVIHVSAVTLDEIIEKLEDNKGKINDLSADVVM